MLIISEVQSIVGFSVTMSFCNRGFSSATSFEKIQGTGTCSGTNEVTQTRHYAASLEINSRFSNWEINIVCAVIPKKTGMIPATFVDSSDWAVPEGLMLADENFNRPNSIDILLEADVFFEVLRHNKRTRLGNYPVLQAADLD
jgi:hypothetical protein